MQADFPMTVVQSGRYLVRKITSPSDLRHAQSFRAQRFALADYWDEDSFDALFDHFILEERQTAETRGYFRLYRMSGADLSQSYAAQFYDLSRLSSYSGTMVELGRFCLSNDISDPDVLRLAWAAITRYVDQCDAGLLFGCSSFNGIDPAPYRSVFKYLGRDYVAPKEWAPGVKADEIFRLCPSVPTNDTTNPDHRLIPPLLRTYLKMGGWVSDHAVVDPELNTLHVFTAVEVKSIPALRKARLRSLV